MIVEVIFSDFYRTFLLCILSVCIAFMARNATKRKRVLAFLGYEAVMLMPFIWILVLSIVFTYYGDGSWMSLVPWELKWILYFTAITILQFLAYQLLWKKSKALKALALLISIIIVVAPLYILDFQKLTGER